MFMLPLHSIEWAIFVYRFFFQRNFHTWSVVKTHMFGAQSESNSELKYNMLSWYNILYFVNLSTYSLRIYYISLWLFLFDLREGTKNKILYEIIAN